MSELEIYKGMVKKMKDGEIKEMTKTVYDLLLKLEQCDDKHNRCDYLMEHDEITYLLEYITNLQQRVDKLNEDKRGMLLELYKANDKKDKLQEENERLKVNCNIGNDNLTFYRNVYKDYKSRCEKAVEIYDDTITYLTTINGEYMDSNTKKTIQDVVNKLEKQLEFLNGRSDE